MRITLNGADKGQFFVNVFQDDFLLRRADLRALGLPDTQAATQIIDGEETVALRSIARLTYAFDEKTLVLAIEVAPETLPRRAIDLAAGRNPSTVFTRDSSAFLNYSLSYTDGNSTQPATTTLANELGVRSGDFLFLTDTTYAATSSDSRFVRLMTSLTNDRRQSLQRTTLGDSFASSGNLGTTVNMGGLSFAKLYRIDPYFVRYPQQNLVGQARTPSDVEVYVDGQRVRTLRVQPGEFELRNLTQTIGARNVEVIVRDAFGREQRIGIPYYSTDLPLKAGLHEYSYNLGAIRQMFGIESNDYGPGMLSMFHRYGVSDQLTLGVRGEAKRDVYNLGPTATIVLGGAGVMNVSAAVSGDGGRAGAAGMFDYTFIGRHWFANAPLRKDSAHYGVLIDPGTNRRDYEANANIGYAAAGLGTISIGYSIFTAYAGQDRKAVSLGYSRPLFDRRASFFATLRNVRAEDVHVEVFAGIVVNLDRQHMLSARYQKTGDNRSETLQLQRNQPVGEGLGYTVAVERAQTPTGESTLLSPAFQYNSRWAILRGNYSQLEDRVGSIRSYQVSVAGGIGLAGGTFGAGRPVTDSFGVVKVGDIEGVRVAVNSLEIGKTDARGKLFLPALASFVDNQVSINPANLPLDYSFPESLKIVSPPFRGGAVVDFAARRLRAFTGTIHIKPNGESHPAEFYEVSVIANGDHITFQTGRDGEFYVENLPPGRHRASFGRGDFACAFDLDIPQASEIVTDLGKVVCIPAK